MRHGPTIRHVRRMLSCQQRRYTHVLSSTANSSHIPAVQQRSTAASSILIYKAPFTSSPRRGPDPFIRLRRLAADQEYHDASSLLDVVPETAFPPECGEAWPLWTFLEILRRPCDQSALIRLMHLAQQYIELEDVGSGAQIARLLLKRIRITRVMVLVPVLMDVMSWRLEAAYADEQIGLDELMGIVTSLLGVLRQFRYFSRINDEHAHTTDLPPIIHAQVFRLATLAIHTAESVPSSSSAQGKRLISHHVRQRLFDRVLLTSRIRNLLLAHIPSQNLLPSECRSCVKSIIMEGGEGAEERAKRFTKMAQAAERKAAKPADRTRLKVLPAREKHAEQETTSPRGRSLEERDEWERAISSVILRKSAISNFQDNLTTIDRITLARCGQNTHALLETLGPFLKAPIRNDTEYDADDTTGPVSHPYDTSNRLYAWSILMHRLSSSEHTSSSDLLDMATDLEKELSIPQVMTPIISGLSSRNKLTDAWTIFTDLSEKQQGAEPGRYIDRELLAAITPVCGQLYGFEAAVALVDQWGRRLGVKTPPEIGTTRYSFTLDVINLNALLSVCVNRRQPSVALRLFAAAQPRWGIWADNISLKLLIDCCRFSHTDPISETDTIRTRLRDLVSEMRLFQSSSSSDSISSSSDPYAAYDLAGFAKGDHRVLLDPPGSSWRETMGDRRPWQAARQIFRDVCLGNWPHLVNVKSPLEFGAFARLDDILRPYPAPEPGESRLPLSSARYTHIIPSASSFWSYISLLGYYGMTEEIPLVLAWARELGIEPNWKSMCSAMAYIGETEGPRRRVRGWQLNGHSLFVRDEQIVRRWLESWVKGPVPTEEEVAAFVRKVRGRGGKMRVRE